MGPGSATSGWRRGTRPSISRRATPTTRSAIWLATELLATRETWVATEPDGRVVAFLALSDDMIDQLYVTPDRIGTGIGSRLIATAKARRPDGLDLYCFQANTRARTFYEHHGFVVDRHGRRLEQLGGPAGHPLRVATGSLIRLSRPGRRSSGSMAGRRGHTTARSGAGRPVRRTGRGRSPGTC